MLNCVEVYLLLNVFGMTWRAKNDQAFRVPGSHQRRNRVTELMFRHSKVATLDVFNFKQEKHEHQFSDTTRL